jgi:hypothetical protein
MPGFDRDPEVNASGFFERINPKLSSNFTPKIWVSFRFGYSWGFLMDDLPRKGPWQPANEGAGNRQICGLISHLEP